MHLRSVAVLVAAASGASPFNCGTPLTSEDSREFLQQEYTAWKQTYVKSFQEGLCVTVPKGDISGNPEYPDCCFSEGIGYGMLIAAYMNDRETFDGFWRFGQHYLDATGGMSWMIWPGHNKSVIGQDGATDADEDIAMALVVAAEKWGAQYLEQARAFIEVIWQNDINHDTLMVLPGDRWGKACNIVDTSYFSPAWYAVFGRVSNRTAEWETVIDRGFEFLGKCNSRNNGTGLTPQWTDGECKEPAQVGKNPGHYWCDATRVALRMGISAAWHCDQRALQQARMLSHFFGGQGAANMYASDVNGGYTILGEPLSTTDTDNACSQECFISTAGAAMVAGSADAGIRQQFWEFSARPPRASQKCYFCDTLRLVSVLFSSGTMREPFAASAVVVV